MVRRWVCGVVVVGIFGSLGWSAPAMAKQPSDYYFTEFVPAELGAILLGGVGLGVGMGHGHFDSTLVLFWGLGRVLGAGIGVTGAGDSLGVQGNAIMAYLLPGASLAILPISALLLDPERDVLMDIAWVLGFRYNNLFNLLGISHLPFVPAVLAVIGYNMGAKMKDTGQPASLPWTLDLPVLSLEF